MNATYSNTIPEGKVPVLNCIDIHPKLASYGVQTTHSEVMDLIATSKADSIENTKRIYVGSLRNLVRWSESELNMHYQKKNQHWINFCNDVILFYVARHILLKKEIPIMLYNSDSEDLKQ